MQVRCELFREPRTASPKEVIADMALTSGLAVALISAVILGYFCSPLSLSYIAVATATGSAAAAA